MDNIDSQTAEHKAAGTLSVSGVIFDALTFHGLPAELALPIEPPYLDTRTGQMTGGKRPATKGAMDDWIGQDDWVTQHVPYAVLMQANEDGANLGVRLGDPSAGEDGISLLAVDIDLDADADPDCKKHCGQILQALMPSMGGDDMLWRETLQHRALLLAKNLSIYESPRKRIWSIHHAGVRIGKLELLGFGQQAVIGGRHYSGRNIVWHHAGSDQHWPVPPINTIGLPAFDDSAGLYGALVKTWDRLGTQGLVFELQSAGGEGVALPDAQKTPPWLTADRLIENVASLKNPKDMDRDPWEWVLQSIAASRRGIIMHHGALDADQDARLSDAIVAWTDRYEGARSEKWDGPEAVRAKWEGDFRNCGNLSSYDRFIALASELGLNPDLKGESAQGDFTAEPRPLSGKYTPVFSANDGAFLVKGVPGIWNTETAALDAIRAHEAAIEKLDNLGKGPEKKRTKRKFLTLADLRDMKPPEWLVEGLIEEVCLAAVYGLPEAGKSFAVLSLGLHIAAGKEWFGKAVKQGAVIYVAGEGAHGIKLRTEAMQAAYGIREDVPFWLVPTSVRFNDPEDVLWFIEDVVNQVPEGTPVRMIIFDTLFWMAQGLDINTPLGMTTIVGAMGQVKAAFGCAVVGVHHEGKDPTKGMMGSLNLLGAIDTSIQVQRDKDSGNVTVTPKKQKDGDPGKPMVFRMETHPTAGGRTTLVPQLVEGATAARATADEPSGQTRLALLALESAVDDEGESLPTGEQFPAGAIGVPVKLWQERFYMKLCPKPGETPKQAANRKWTAFSRALKNLQATGRIDIANDWIWFTDQPGIEFDVEPIPADMDSIP
jgi:hypothetical protein